MTARRDTPARPARLAVLLGALLALVAGALVVAAPAQAARPLEPYAAYDGQRFCNPAAKPGAVALQDWLVMTYGGSRGPISRPCSSGGQSEHKEGRALDWTMDAARAADRQAVRRFLDDVFAKDSDGRAHATARRMGIMYIIWNDRIWRSYDRFAVGDYRPCAKPADCSKTARHRDHVHISLSRPGGRGKTSWYEGRV